jgi:hypothetical protein
LEDTLSLYLETETDEDNAHKQDESLDETTIEVTETVTLTVNGGKARQVTRKSRKTLVCSCGHTRCGAIGIF